MKKIRDVRISRSNAVASRFSGRNWRAIWVMATELRRIRIELTIPTPPKAKIIAANAAPNFFPIVQFITLALSAPDERFLQRFGQLQLCFAERFFEHIRGFRFI